MHGISVGLSCGATAIACYLWGSYLKGKADYFNSITRVIELNGLDDLLKEKTTNPLVVVSGRVASAAPINCGDYSPLGFVYERKEQCDYETKFFIETKLVDMLLYEVKNILRGLNQTPWYLEDTTGRVNVVGAKDAVGFFDILKVYVDRESEIYYSPKEGYKVLYRTALDVGTYLNFVGEAVRDKAGNLMIQKPKEQPFMVFKGEGSFDKMVDKLKSNSEFYIFYSKIFGGIAVAVAVMYGVDFIRRWKKKNFDNKRPKNAKSDSEGTDISHL